jgi:ABC-type sulfate transport system permease component
MDAQRLDGHKKVLGILYVISSLLTALGMLILNALLSFVFSFAFQEIDPEEQRIVELVMGLMQYLPAIVIVLFVLPTLIAGIGLLTRQSWATLLALIIGCLKLFSFPIGTAIGIYAIWIFSEDQKLARAS